MEKFIGLYRKGSTHDSFGFISDTNNSNLFIHDREFKEGIEWYDGNERYVTFKLRDSKVKRGNTEGYDGILLASEKDASFLTNELLNRIEKVSEDSYNYSERLCCLIIDRLKDTAFEIDRLVFISNYFDEKTIENFLFRKQNSIKFRVLKYGLEVFFPNLFESLLKKIDELNEAKILKEMGYEGVNIYEVLTSTFFNNFPLFERNFEKFKKNINREFIYKVILESDTLPWDESFKSIKRFIVLINKNRTEIDKENAFRVFSNLSTPKIRLYLWLNDLSGIFDFNEYKENVWRLEKKDQAIFFKKLFYSKSKGLINFELSDLNQIDVFNISTFRQIKLNKPEKNFINLDFNVSLVVHILNSISDSANFKGNIRSKIFEYFVEYMTDSKDYKHIDCFYTKCIGRTSGQAKIKTDTEALETDLEKENNKAEYDCFYYHDKNDKPLFHSYCDGQKAIKAVPGFPPEKIISWCAGLPCFESALLNNTFENCLDLTLKDFLAILKIPFDLDTIAALSGYINKANLLIDRLKCNSCNSLMVPTGISNFAYHVINIFHCATEACTEYNKDVYLSHCFNKNCSNLIDSRNSTRCKHDGFGEFCGWYICDICYSCCSTEKIQQIIERKRLHGLPYRCSTIGHDELKVAFCYHCGDKMRLNIDFYKRQQEIISSLTSKKKKHFIERAEKKNGFWKFRLNLSSISNVNQVSVVEQLTYYGFNVVKGRYPNIYFADLLICIALKCVNKDCVNEVTFSPDKRSKWKAFNDAHSYLREKVTKFYDEGDIELVK